MDGAAIGASIEAVVAVAEDCDSLVVVATSERE
jgi:hypothetical protein